MGDVSEVAEELRKVESVRQASDAICAAYFLTSILYDNLKT